jgi:hypothetical protein
MPTTDPASDESAYKDFAAFLILAELLQAEINTAIINPTAKVLLFILIFSLTPFLCAQPSLRYLIAAREQVIIIGTGDEVVIRQAHPPATCFF